MLESTEPEESPDQRPFAPSEGVEGAHALELRAESMRQYAERGAQRTGALDRTEVGDSDDNRDVVAGRDAVEVGGMLDEHTGHGLVVVADEVEMSVGGPLTMHAHLEDNIIMAGVMRDEFAGGTLVTAAMSDDLVAGGGLRSTAPLDVWVHGLVGMEERPGTCTADGLLFELAGTLYEREYGPSGHMAAVARHSGTVVTTMKTGFRPLMKVALGVRNLIPGGGGGGGSASASPPAAPPAPPPGGEAGAAMLTAAEGGGSLARGAAGGGDNTDEIATVVRTVESASEGAEVEELQHPASTADNLDNLARVDAEGGGYRQVADAYEQPLPASAAQEPDAGPASGSDSAAPASGYKKAPELDLTEPGADGYTFQSSYGQLREQVEHFRADSNWRGNLFSREYLQAVDDKASELFKGLGGDPLQFAGDNRNYRTSDIYAEMQRMLDRAAEAGDLFDVVEIRTAMDELEGFVHGSAVDFAARTDEFAGTALGSQRLPIDPNIDTDKLRRWLQEQIGAAQENYFAAQVAGDQAGWTQANWEVVFYDQVLKSLDAGMNPLAESSEQTFFIQATKVIPENEKYIAQTTADIIALGLDPNDFDIIPPRAADQDQLDAFLEFHDRFVETLSDPEFHRSAAEVGDSYAPALHGPGGPGPDQPGPGSLGPSAGAVEEPDVHPVVGAGDPPPPPPALNDPVADSSPGAGPSEAVGGRSRAEPPALYDTRPGAEGYDFNDAHDTLRKRNHYYRDSFAFRGNFFMREYIQDIDAEALRLLKKVKGPTDEITADFGRVAPDVYRTLQRMAEQADAAGDAGRAADIRTAIGELEAMVDSTLAEAATRADEFAGTARGSQRAPIDRHIDTAKLRSWLEEQMQAAIERRAAIPLDEPEASRLAGLEQTYYHEMIRCLDEGTNPLASSNEQIAVINLNKVQPHLAEYADDIAAGRPYPRIQAQDELELYVRLQELLLSTLEDTEFHRSLDEMDLDTYADGPRRRIQQMLDRLGGDSLRPVAGGDIPPPLPAADFADGAVYVDEIRDWSFSRSALAASEEALERQAAGVAEGGASARDRTPIPDSAPPEPSLGTRRAPPRRSRGSAHRRALRQVAPRAVHGARFLPDARAGWCHPGTGGRRLAACVRCLVGVGASGVRGLRDRPRRRHRRRCGHLECLQGAVRARGGGSGGDWRGAPRLRRERRRRIRRAARPLRRHEGRGWEPDRYRLRTGRLHDHPRPRRRDRSGSFGRHLVRPPGHARAGVHRRPAGGRLCGGRECRHRRHSLGPLRRARVVRGTLARGGAPVRRSKGAGPDARRCGGSGRRPPSRRPRPGRVPAEVHSPELRRHARSRRPPRPARRNHPDAHRCGAANQAAVQRRHGRCGQRVERRIVERRAQGCRRGTRGKRPLVRIHHGATYVDGLVQRRSAPDPVPRRVRQHREKEGH